MAKKPLLKGAVDKLLVLERKKMRVAQRESKFKQRTLNIYKGQVARAKELGKDLLYTIDEFRTHVRQQLDVGKCPYCDCNITVIGFVCDHKNSVARGGEFVLDNTVACCKSCNWRKGLMNYDEFIKFNEFLSTLPPEVVRDIRARLSMGGKWVSK